jgi:uncharacterized secreted protein with C-terminal beta-propeller domain
MKQTKRLIALLLSGVLLASCSKTVPAETDPAVPGTEPAETDVIPAENGENPETEKTGLEETPEAAPANVSKHLTVVTPASYHEVWEKLNIRRTSNAWRSYTAGDEFMVEEAAEAEAPMPAPEPAAAYDTAEMDMVAEKASAADENGYGVDYSETNTQVKGIDEADIVKTDGQYIYALYDGEVRIYSAAGAETALLSRTTVSTESGKYYLDDWDWVVNEKNDYGFWKSASEMYVLGDTLAVISDCSEYANAEVNGIWRYEDKSYTLIDFYDVSNRWAPVLMSSEGQDGYYQSSRLMDGKIYLITNRYVYTWNDLDEGTYSDYIPFLYRNGEAKEIALDRICWPETSEDSSFTVVGRYSVDSRSVEDTLSVLGAGNTLYMSPNYLYLADSRWFEDKRGEFAESVYRVEEYVSGNRTEILKLTVADRIEVVASGTADGNLLNQFSMDEYNGYLRAVTTSWNSNYQIWRDEEHDFTNWKYLESGQVNALWIFDENMNLTGSIGGLAKDEQVYSVRFDGEVGYFVTFRQVDPLFAVNLSDPANPIVMSALKIPGFSRYLHPWSSTLLFGLGQDADEETGRTNGMKLSMFDTSNPYDVTERDKLLIDSGYSEALYNHKAILIAPAKGIIGFPADSGYVLYRYEEGSGFTLANKIELTDDEWYWSWNSRGLYVGDIIYIVSDRGITVLDMMTGDYIVTVRN